MVGHLGGMVRTRVPMVHVYGHTILWYTCTYSSISNGTSGILSRVLWYVRTCTVVWHSTVYRPLARRHIIIIITEEYGVGGQGEEPEERGRREGREGEEGDSDRARRNLCCAVH